MSDISTKLTYLNTTKGKIKDVINMTGANITSDTTFRNYATKLYDGYVSVLKDKNTLLDNMPKDTSTGAITDAADLPLYEDKMSKESTQETTTGKNKITFNNLSDISLLNIQTHYDNSTIKFNGTTNGSGQLIPISPLNIMLPVGTYTISYRIKSGTYNVGTAGNDIAFYLRNDSSTLLNQTLHFISTDGTPQSKNFTLTENTLIYFQAYCNASGIVLNNLVLEVQIEEGTTVTEYEPYTNGPSPNPDYPQEVKNVKGNTNIFNPNQNFERGQYNNGVWENNNARVTTEFFPTKTGDKWNIFVDLDDIQKVELINYNFFDENKVWLGSRIENGEASIAGKKSHSFQINIANVAYMRISFRSSLGAYVELPISNVKNSKAQLTNGWEQMPYIPYGTNNYIKVNISNGTDSIEKYIFLNNNEICGIGDYKDELIVDKNGKCWLNKKIVNIVLKNKTEWYKAGVTNIDRYSTPAINGGTNNMKILSKYFKWISGNESAKNDVGQIWFNTTNGQLYLNYAEYNTSTLESFLNFLNTTNASIYYPLATSQLIDLNYTVDLTLFEGVNNISNSEDMDMDIKYIKESYE